MDSSKKLYKKHITWNKRTLITLIICIAVPLVVGMISAFLSRSGMRAFNYMNKPPLAPPAALFPIAWTVLYILMGTASFLILKSTNHRHMFTIFIYIMQLVFNFTWSIIFFTLQAYALAAVWLGILIFMIIELIINTARISIPAMIMLTPYLYWCLFAMYLNIGIAILN